MVKIYLGIEDLLIIFAIIVIVICVFISFIRELFKSKPRVNCHECKYYNMDCVDMSNGKCKYRCLITGRIDKTTINNSDRYIKCNKFEK